LLSWIRRSLSCKSLRLLWIQRKGPLLPAPPCFLSCEKAEPVCQKYRNNANPHPGNDQYRNKEVITLVPAAQVTDPALCEIDGFPRRLIGGLVELLFAHSAHKGFLAGNPRGDSLPLPDLGEVCGWVLLSLYAQKRLPRHGFAVQSEIGQPGARRQSPINTDDSFGIAGPFVRACCGVLVVAAGVLPES
jgi:hypothetical protein